MCDPVLSLGDFFFFLLVLFCIFLHSFVCFDSSFCSFVHFMIGFFLPSSSLPFFFLAASSLPFPSLPLPFFLFFLPFAFSLPSPFSSPLRLPLSPFPSYFLIRSSFLCFLLFHFSASFVCLYRLLFMCCGELDFINGAAGRPLSVGGGGEGGEGKVQGWR